MTECTRHHIATGTYYIGRKSPFIIEAFLGTCVGVVIYDKKAGVGGLLHLLLPKPFAQEALSAPDRYASTGIPRFLEALKNAGAQPENMRAWIAGGALVGPLTRQDLSLDIGGRTAEIAIDLIKKEGIAIENQETGGFFTCSLSLNLTTWKADIQPAGSNKLHTSPLPPPPKEKDIEKAIRSVQPVPQIALKIMRLISEDSCNFKHIATMVRQDQVLTAKTLQMCNSAFFTGRSKIASLEDALIILGQDQLVKSILQVAIDKYFSQAGNGYALCKGGLFHHAIGTATIAEKLALITDKAIPAVAYTAGLLHDIGMVVLDRYVTETFPLFYRAMQVEGGSILEAERTHFGTDHMEIGRRLAVHASFPESLIETIACHHKPGQASISPELTHIVYLAELFMSRFHAGLELERTDTEDFSQRLAVLDLAVEDVALMIDRIPQTVFSHRQEQENRNEAE